MTATVSPEAPLEDLMAAMDVVDTLRHERGIAERELDSDDRRERLLVRLQEMYKAQGIDVSDRVLRDGIEALEQDRFKYTPITPSWRTKIAHMWVSRRRWGKPVGFLALVGSLFSGFYIVNDVLPEREMRAGLPRQIQSSLIQIREIAKNPAIIQMAEQRAGSARRAIVNENFSEAQVIVSDLRSVSQSLEQEYSIRVVSRPNQNSGIWRVPPNQPRGRNYYLIVEAFDKANTIVPIKVLNQENNKRESKSIWGLRVSEETFYKIAKDKGDDGIIQDNKVGYKAVGFLEPTFSIATTGATITEW